MTTIQVKAYFLKRRKISKEAVSEATEIRRFNVELEQNNTYNILLQQIKTFFQNIVSTKHSIKTFYLDDENEFVGFSTDSELKFALNMTKQTGLFKIYITRESIGEDLKDISTSSNDETDNHKEQQRRQHWRKWKHLSGNCAYFNNEQNNVCDRKREQRRFFWRMWKNMMENQKQSSELKEEKLGGDQSCEESKKHGGHHRKQWKEMMKNCDSSNESANEKSERDQSCGKRKEHRKVFWQMWKNMIENQNQSSELNKEKSGGDLSCNEAKGHHSHHHRHHKKWLMWKNMMQNQKQSSELKEEKSVGDLSCEESTKHGYYHREQWKMWKKMMKNCDESKDKTLDGDQSYDEAKSHHKKCLRLKKMMESSRELKDENSGDELKQDEFEKYQNEIEKKIKPQAELEQDNKINLPTISAVLTVAADKDGKISKVNDPSKLKETKTTTKSSSSTDLFPKLSVEPNLLNMNGKIDDVSKTVECLKEMGFDDNCNWLTALVQSKNGNINEALDALSPMGFK